MNPPLRPRPRVPPDRAPDALDHSRRRAEPVVSRAAAAGPFRAAHFGWRERARGVACVPPGQSAQSRRPLSDRRGPGRAGIYARTARWSTLLRARAQSDGPASTLGRGRLVCGRQGSDPAQLAELGSPAPRHALSPGRGLHGEARSTEPSPGRATPRSEGDRDLEWAGKTDFPEVFHRLTRCVLFRGQTQGSRGLAAL